MEKLLVRGGRPLRGTVTVSGAKNAAVALLPATILARDACVVDNLPEIQDVLLLRDILSRMGAKVEYVPEERRMTVDTSADMTTGATFGLVRRMRASYYLLGALLARYGHAQIALPGGCDIGQRPIDQHLKGLRALGAEVETEHGILKAKTNGLRGAEVYLDVASVGATVNIMLASVHAEGLTTIVNAAKEPHVVDLANFLNCMGASVKGAGTDVIRVRGKKDLHGTSYTIIPDQIEAGTLMIAAAATRGDVVIQNVISTHLESISAKLIEMGVHVDQGYDHVRVYSDKRPRHVTIKTLPYPGFPTDIQQPISALLCTAEGTSVIIESIFEDRFKQVAEFCRMGARVSVDNRVAVIEGVEKLTGAPVTASDLRAGAALIVAGLMAEGETYIKNVKFIDRGYERIEDKLISLGASIERIEVEDEYGMYE
ncbi:MAG: UDP-N-acetylglucosamine 1-carboxyvinyltransferase [Clostridiales bacterium]|nr:UDP-N-acetylglucosamine 1-carboxyvinyltransferase [Clostridiales bacterium]